MINLCDVVWTAYVYVGPPRYLAAFLMNLAAAALAIVFAVATYLYLRRHNARLDRGEDTGKNGPTAAQQAAGFRYTL
jgi:NADH:ubiquinone oxidoreductase subunit K